MFPALQQKPEDISIIGFDDLIVSGVIRPKIWIAVQPMEEMCEKAVELLLHRIKHGNEELPVKIHFSVQFREGDSIRRL